MDHQKSASDAADESAVSAAIALAVANHPLIVEMKAKLAASEAENAKLRAAAEAVAESPKPGVATESQASSPARWGIVLDPAREKNEIDPVFVSVNGRAYHMKRGKYIEVPREVIEVLNHAVQTISVTEFNDQGIAIGSQANSARRFPYRMYGQAVAVNGDRMLPEGGPKMEEQLFTR